MWIFIVRNLHSVYWFLRCSSKIYNWCKQCIHTLIIILIFVLCCNVDWLLNWESSFKIFFMSTSFWQVCTCTVRAIKWFAKIHFTCVLYDNVVIYFYPTPPPPIFIIVLYWHVQCLKEPTHLYENVCYCGTNRVHLNLCISSLIRIWNVWNIWWYTYIFILNRSKIDTV